MKKACCKSCAQGKHCEGEEKEECNNNYLEEKEQDNHLSSEEENDLVFQENENHYYAKRKNKRSHESSLALQKFAKRVHQLQKVKSPSYRPIEIYEHRRALYEAMIFPELAKGIKFPSNFMIPTYSFQMKTSFTLTTNAFGNCLVQLNQAQFLDPSRYKTGAVGSQNGTSDVGNSNLFICNDVSLNAVNPVSNIGTIMQAQTVLQAPNNFFNAVRPGPACIQYEYIGRLDIAAGNVTMGITYSNVTDPVGVTSSVNGLYPDPTYSTQANIEDCPLARMVPATTSLKGILIPHDESVLNLKSTIDASSTPMPQRLYLLINAAPPAQIVARITITQNWEGVPSSQFADFITCTYNTFPTEFDGKDIYSYMVANNLVITKNESEFGLYKFIGK